MKSLLILLSGVIIITSCSNEKKEKTNGDTDPKAAVSVDSTLLTDSTWGPITRTTDLSGLEKMYGKDNIADMRICGPECADSVDVTIIYPNQSNQITVYWMDSLYHKKITFLESYADDAPFKTDKGIKVGSTLADLLRVNGKKITFSGFGWDYGGLVQSYNKGALDSSNINFAMSIDDYDDETLVGDTELDTDMPSVKKALDKIRIWRITHAMNRIEFIPYEY